MLQYYPLLMEVRTGDCIDVSPPSPCGGFRHHLLEHFKAEYMLIRKLEKKEPKHIGISSFRKLIIFATHSGGTSTHH
jgi:hypothetical protein